MTPQNDSTPAGTEQAVPLSLTAQRNIRRAAILDVEIDRARRAAFQCDRSDACTAPWHLEALNGGDLTPHPTCAGLRAFSHPPTVGTGCLCACHDAEAAGDDGREVSRG